MVKIKNLNFEELQDFVQNLGLEKYRAKQIAQWLYKKRVKSFDEMTNISKSARKLLSENA